MLALCGLVVLALLSSFWVLTTSTTVHSRQSPDQIAACLAAGDRNFVDVSPLPKGGEQIDILNGKRSSIARYSIHPDAEGSRVDYRRELFAMTSVNRKNCV